LPAGVTPHAPEQHDWAQPHGAPVQGHAAPVRPEKQYEQSEPHAAVQQYDFILNPENPVKKPLLIPTGNSMLSRLAIGVGGLVVLVILVVVIAGLLGGSSGGNLAALTTVAQDQTELTRVANLSTSQTPSQDVANVAINTSLSVSSAKQQLLTYLADNGHNLGVKDLNLKRDTRTDTQLQTAAAASNFDSTFISVLQTQLDAYQRDLKLAYGSTTGPKGKALLSSQYDAAELLLKQLKQ